MANTSGIRAGRAFVELGVNNKIAAGLKRAQRQLRAFGSSVSAVGLKLAGSVTAITAPIGLFTIKAAADAQESLSRFEAVFKDQSKAAGQFANDIAESVGRSKFAIMDALATFQGFFVGLGFDSDKSRELSQSLEQLSLDFASFNNISDEESMQRFISALSGSSEVLDRFGINTKQAALQQELLTMGINKSWNAVTEQEKAMARLSVIAKSMGDQGAIGDAVRTAGSFTNQMKRLRGSVHDSAVEIGNALLPVVTPLVTKAADAAKAVGKWISANKELVATAFKVSAGIIAAGAAMVGLGFVFSSLGTVLGGLASAVSFAATVFGVIVSAITAILSPIGLVISAVVALAGTILVTSQAGADALQWLSERWVALKNVVFKVIGGIADALAAGDISLAAKILWLALKLAWQTGTKALLEIWESLWAQVQIVGIEVWSKIIGAFRNFRQYMENAFPNLTAAIVETWSSMVFSLRSTWAEFQKWLTDQIIKIWGVFDKEIDVQGMLDLNEQELEADLQNIESDHTKRVSEAIRKRQRTPEEKAAEHALENAEAQARKRDNIAEVLADRNQSIAEAAKELTKARGELDAAIAVAKGKKDAIDAGPPIPQRKIADPLAGLADKLKGIGKTVADKISTTGTFNTSALFGLGQSAAEETARATAQTATNTAQILNITKRRRRLAFGG